MRTAAGVVLSLVLITGCNGRATTSSTVPVTFSGGHGTDPRDSGRPVALVAGALGVPASVFRTAFSAVTPAAAGTAPDLAQVGRNKKALLAVLSPYGVTNERLDEVSNYYRYAGAAGQMWPTRTAKAVAVVKDGKVVSLRVTDGGAGYTTPPSVAVPGFHVSATATLAFGSTFATNGSISSVG